jgi:hypothetical protein
MPDLNFPRILLVASFFVSLVLAGCGTQNKPSIVEPALPVVDVSTTGTITGTVKMTGKPAELKPIDMSAEPMCVAQNPKPVRYPSVITGKHGELANTVVYVKSGLDKFRYDTPPDATVLNQKKCMYGPHVIALMVQQRLQVHNEDPVLHNIRIAPRQNHEWNESEDVGSAPVEYSFQHPELAVLVRCNVHPWMRAIAFVFDHPYFAVTSSDGNFVLKNVPPGTYTIEAWQERFGLLDKTVTVAAKGYSSTSFVFKSAAKH